MNIIAGCTVPDRLIPSESTLKAVQIGGGKHPAWKVEGLDVDELLRVCAIGTMHGLLPADGNRLV